MISSQEAKIIMEKLNILESKIDQNIKAGRYMTARQAANELGYAAISSLSKFEEYGIKDPNVKGHKNYLREKVEKLRDELFIKKING